MGHEIRASMRRKDDFSDNAIAECFFTTLEWAPIERSDWRTRQEARRAIFDYIKIWYHRGRCHSTLSYLNPAEYEGQLVLMTKAALAPCLL